MAVALCELSSPILTCIATPVRVGWAWPSRNSRRSTASRLTARCSRSAASRSAFATCAGPTSSPGWGPVALAAEEAAEALAGRGIEATVVDLRWLAPLDDEAIAAAVGRTNRVLIAHEANVTGGFGAEIAAFIGERHFDAPVRRVGAPDVRLPAAPALQAALLPSADSIARAAERLALEE
ncbi:MAG: hypothetical protein ICV69_07995 [Thermoleophilaceae bacterium]|nr:hypothetical protein [Thermoleophilaceae bacterium]